MKNNQIQEGTRLLKQLDSPRLEHAIKYLQFLVSDQELTLLSEASLKGNKAAELFILPSRSDKEGVISKDQ